MAEETLTLSLDSGGDVVIKLRPDLAPGHVARIVELAKEGFYDGVVFHRVIPGFMAQGGDPTGTGMGGSEKPDMKAEFSSEPHVRGICSMARSSNPNSANSQFFIVFDDATFLDKPIYGVGRSDVRHGLCRRAAQGRAAAHAGQDRQGDGGA
jgi:peptidylprolyl isomerase